MYVATSGDDGADMSQTYWDDVPAEFCTFFFHVLHLCVCCFLLMPFDASDCNSDCTVHSVQMWVNTE